MEKIIVGKIVNTHGIKGELKVQRFNYESFDRGNAFYIDGYDSPVYVVSSRQKDDLSFIKLDGFNNINEVLQYKNKYIRVLEEDLYDLDQDEFFIKDLINLDVYDQDQKLVGKLYDVETYAANDVYIISTNQGKKSIPAVKEFIKEIDLDNKKIIVKLIEGM
ncbi:MAG: ribosome maturation factor RimM [Tissierellia bacterium]|nr:ribosome maturation factor RimM [Tissierellia bacterium]